VSPRNLVTGLLAVVVVVVAVLLLSGKDDSYTLKAGDNFLVDMGFVEGLTPDEVPTYGWTYANVHVEVYK